MNKTIIAMVLAACSYGAAAQTTASRRTTPAATQATHMPAQKTEASMTEWVKKYPAEAGTYTEGLKARMQAQPQTTAADQQQYDAMKQEYNSITLKLRDAGAHTSAIPARKN